MPHVYMISVLYFNAMAIMYSVVSYSTFFHLCFFLAYACITQIDSSYYGAVFWLPLGSLG
jgi:hypothetical protein